MSSLNLAEVDEALTSLTNQYHDGCANADALARAIAVARTIRAEVQRYRRIEDDLRDLCRDSDTEWVRIDGDTGAAPDGTLSEPVRGVAARLVLRTLDDHRPAAPTPLPGTAIVYLASTRWGHGTTTCLICEQRFAYAFGATIYAVHAPDLCDRACGGSGSHRWDCAALGGDVCESCVVGFEAFGPNELAASLQAAAGMHRRAAEVLTKYAAAEWSVRREAGTPYPDQRGTVTGVNESTEGVN